MISSVQREKESEKTYRNFPVVYDKPTGLNGTKVISQSEALLKQTKKKNRTQSNFPSPRLQRTFPKLTLYVRIVASNYLRRSEPCVMVPAANRSPAGWTSASVVVMERSTVREAERKGTSDAIAGVMFTRRARIHTRANLGGQGRVHHDLYNWFTTGCILMMSPEHL